MRKFIVQKQLQGGLILMTKNFKKQNPPCDFLNLKSHCIKSASIFMLL